jgi:CheY-like chemotaxis protein
MSACVLVVDDDEALREIVVEAISDAGYTVAQAENGKVALERMRESPPCIVLLDLMMPVMDGWEVVDQMTADPALAAVAVCVVSAQSSLAPPKHACILKKPVTLAELLKAIEEHCGKVER